METPAVRRVGSPDGARGPDWLVGSPGATLLGVTGGRESGPSTPAAWWRLRLTDDDRRWLARGAYKPGCVTGHRTTPCWRCPNRSRSDRTTPAGRSRSSCGTRDTASPALPSPRQPAGRSGRRLVDERVLAGQVVRHRACREPRRFDAGIAGAPDRRGSRASDLVRTSG